MPHVATVARPVLSADGDTALVLVDYDVEVTHPDLMGNVDAPRERRRRRPATPGYQVELNGGVPESAAAPMEGRGELIGVVAALVILRLRVRLRGRPPACRSPSRSRAWPPARAGSPCSPARWTSPPPRRRSRPWSASASASTTRCCSSPGTSSSSARGTTCVEAAGRGHGHRRALGRVRRAHRAGLAHGPPAGRAVDVRLLRLRHRDRRGLRAVRRARAGARACRLAGRRLLPRKVRGDRRARAAKAPLTARWAARVGRRPLPWAIFAAAVMVLLAAAGAGHAHLAAGPEHRSERAHHPAGVRPDQRRVRRRAPTPRSWSSPTATDARRRRDRRAACRPGDARRPRLRR